jgi:hypothetical protein
MFSPVYYTSEMCGVACVLHRRQELREGNTVSVGEEFKLRPYHCLIWLAISLSTLYVIQGGPSLGLKRYLLPYHLLHCLISVIHERDCEPLWLASPIALNGRDALLAHVCPHLLLLRLPTALATLHPQCITQMMLRVLCYPIDLS